MIPTTPLQFELAQLVTLDHPNEESRIYCRPEPAQSGLTRRGLHGMGRGMVRLGRWLEETTRPSDIYERFGEGGMVI
ncbi:MAG: hypothetical protein KC441_17030 [Anaerolineales bacterium]|nr:hypothetical protein [Anaerolineales bacterium]